jgi:virulence-associated protein VagC
VTFFGVETPFLLRPMPGSENKFRLLEEAFMEDFMKGENTDGDNVKRGFFVLY